MGSNAIVIGVDFGTDSVRSVVVDAATGDELGSATHYYARWMEGKFCDPKINQFRQHPLDYLEGLETSITGALSQAGDVGQRVKAISVDTTGSTVVAVNSRGMPLALTAGYELNPMKQCRRYRTWMASKRRRRVRTFVTLDCIKRRGQPLVTADAQP